MSNKEILTLLRAGALEQAEKEYTRQGLDRDTSSEDMMALGGRILKARALEHSGSERVRLALQAAEKYAAAHARFGGTFSGINTASLYLVGGEIEQARSTALSVQNVLQSNSPKPGADAYYNMATAAEACLILGEHARAEQILADAIPLDPHNYDAHASTIRQFEMILAATRQPHDWLNPFRPPKSLHFAGHLFGLKDGRNPLDSTAIYGLEKAVDDMLEGDRFGAAFGALAAGSDIIIAERLLEHGIELHAVQPCPDALFGDISLSPFGSDWQARFDVCINKAASVRFVSHDTTVCDDLTTAFASETAMGLAVLRADMLATTAEQLLVWDRKPTTGPSGTARDARLWRAAGRHSHIVPFPFERTAVAKTTIADPKNNRSLKAMIFADVKGFGQLSELQVPLFVEHVLAPLADVCGAADTSLSHSNTWGDGLFLVFDSVAAAAATAVNLQAAFQNIDLPATGLPNNLALRVGGHYGPVHSLNDPVLGQTGIFGREVTVAARIEPITAPGSIFVSEPFACALALADQFNFRCEPITAESIEGGGATLFALRRTHLASTKTDHP